MSRSRWFNIVAVVLIVLIVGTFAAIAIPGVMQDQNATATPDATYTPLPPGIAISDAEAEPLQLPVQIGSITLTADLTDAEALASAVPRDTMGAFSIPTPMYGGPTYIMSVDEAHNMLATDPLLPTFVPQPYTMSQWYGYDGLISIAYTTDAFEHSLVINEQRSTSNAQTYAVGSTPIYGTAVHGNFGVYLEQAPLGWIPPFLSFDAALGSWQEHEMPKEGSIDGTVWPFNALIWEENGLMIRVMSSSLSIDELLTVAESMTPNGYAVNAPTNGTPTPTPLPTPSLGTYFIPEVPVNVTLPPNYTLSLIDSPRYAAIGIYEVLWMGDRLLPNLALVQFLTYESVKQYAADCTAGLDCFDTGIPSPETYIAEYEAFMNGTPLSDAETKTLGAHTYFVRQLPCQSDGCFMMYTTFIGETRADVWVQVESDLQVEEADALIAQIMFDQQSTLPPTPAPTPTVQTVNLGDTFATAPMQQINIAGQDLSLMVTYINDSRCPANVECASAGSVAIDVDVTLQGSTSTIHMILEAGATPEVAITGGYAISLIAVETFRDPPNGPPTGYTITMMVDQALTD